MKRTLKILLVLAMVAPMLTSCGPKKRVVRVANFMTDPILISILADQVKIIEKQNPGLEVRLESIPYSDYQQKILTQCAAHNAPDVLYVEVNNFVNLFYPGVFENLNSFVERDRIDLKTFYPGVVGRFTRDGQLFAIPQDTAPTGLVFYNKKIFKEAGLKAPPEGWSWPEPFLSICQKLVKKDAKGHITRFAFCDPYATDVGNFVYSNGASWVDDVVFPRKCTINTPAFLKAARFRWDLIHTYHVSPDPSQLQTFSSGAGVENMFCNGQVAMMASGLWHTPRFLKEPGLEFDVVPFPKGPGGKRGWGSGGSGYAMARESKHKEDAWKVIRALTGEETLRRMAATGFLQPALIKMAESDAFLKSPGPAHKGLLLKMPADARYFPFNPHWNEIQYGMIGPAMDRVWNGDDKPEPVLRELADKINRKYFPGK